MMGEEIIAFIKNNKLELSEVSICVDSDHIDQLEYWETDHETKHITLDLCDWQGSPRTLLISSINEPVAPI